MGTSPTFYKPLDPVTCFALYIEQGTYEKLATKTGISVATLKAWGAEHNWVNKRRAIILAAMKAVEDEAVDVIKTNRIKVMRRHLNAGQEVVDAGVAMLATHKAAEYKALTSREYRDIAGGIKSGADVDARVVGLDAKDRPDTKDSGIFGLNAHDLRNVATEAEFTEQTDQGRSLSSHADSQEPENAGDSSETATDQPDDPAPGGNSDASGGDSAK